MEKTRTSKWKPRRLVPVVATGALLAVSLPAFIIPTTTAYVHEWRINTPEYKAEFGKWDLLDIDADLKINAIHSVLLPTGDVLLIAGSGNDAKHFEAGTFQTLLYSPETGEGELIDTPEDLFCNGHAHLPNGNVLVAGGTQGYEVLPENKEAAGGVLTLVNENPDKEYVVEAGTTVKGLKSGKEYVTDSDITVPAAKKTQVDDTSWDVSSTERNVYINSVEDGEAGMLPEGDQFVVEDMKGDDRENLHGYSAAIDMSKKEYQGIDVSYEFDPFQKKYIKGDPMNYARWYPTLTSMHDGHVIALSGLDAAGNILDGQNEVYDPDTKKWTEREDLRRFFPTYPAVFQTAEEDVLFSAGPSTGWGPHDQGRDPGFWDLTDNTFDIVPGLRDPDLLETGSASWLGPVNDQRLVVVGGGGIGHSEEATGRIDVIDLDSEAPEFEALADLPDQTRYPNLVTLPTGDMFITNGSRDYRGRGASDIFKSYMLDHETGALADMAEPEVGRNYHSTAIMLPNGQILVAGSDPLFADEENTQPGKFDQRIEIFTPPYLYGEDGELTDRPAITSVPETSSRGSEIVIEADQVQNSAIEHVRLMVPSAVTHVTDTNQRMVDVPFTVGENGELIGHIPDNPALVPDAHYMVVVVDERGVPSEAAWTHVTGEGAGEPADAEAPAAEHAGHAGH